MHSSPLKNTALRLSEAIQVHQKVQEREAKRQEDGMAKIPLLETRAGFLFFTMSPKKVLRFKVTL